MKQLLEYFPNLFESQIEQLAQLKDLYSDWNQKINLISRKDIEHLYERHVLHSMSISKIIQFKQGTSILDIGTGGGFPGIPLAILFPNCNFYLIDAIRKKTKVVSEIVESLKLKNVKVKHLHSNELNEKFDFIVSRAVTAFPQFIKLAQGKINQESMNSLPNGILYLKGGDLSDEIKDFQKSTVLYPISDFFSEEFFITKYIVYYPI